MLQTAREQTSLPFLAHMVRENEIQSNFFYAQWQWWRLVSSSSSWNGHRSFFLSQQSKMMISGPQQGGSAGSIVEHWTTLNPPRPPAIYCNWRGQLVIAVTIWLPGEPLHCTNISVKIQQNLHKNAPFQVKNSQNFLERDCAHPTPLPIGGHPLPTSNPLQECLAMGPDLTCCTVMSSQKTDNCPKIFLQQSKSGK